MYRLRNYYAFIFLLLLLSCSNDSGNRNPFLAEIGFRFEIDLNLPLYSPLRTTGNAVLINGNGVGIRGVFVMNSGFNVFRAFEASCPNHAPNQCSTMSLNSQVAQCACEDFEYSLFTGQMLDRPQDDNQYYDMLEYRTSGNGEVIIISN